MTTTYVPIVGNLKIENIYSYFNMPLLFTAVNEFGDTYFISYIEHTDLGELWMMIRVTPSEIHKLESKEIDIRSLFLESKSGNVIFAELKDDDSDASLNFIKTTDVNLLPYLADPGVFVSVSRKTIDIEKTIYLNSNYTIVHKNLSDLLRSEKSNPIKSNDHDIEQIYTLTKSQVNYSGLTRNKIVQKQELVA